MNTGKESLLAEKIESMISMSGESKALFLKNAKLCELNKNEFLLREGEVCRHVYFIEQGCLISYLNKDGKIVNLGFHIENSFVTNLKSLQTEKASEIYIKANEASRVWKIEKSSLMALYEQSGEIMSLGRKLLEELLLEQEEHSNIFKVHTPAERYEYFLAHFPALMQRISLTQLSSYLGISRETLNRIRRK